MPAEGVKLTPKEHLMSYEEIYEIAKIFVQNGVSKIRLTGGEPFIRKDIAVIFKKLASLPVELAITTNGVTIDKHIASLKKYNIKAINISLDTLKAEKFTEITRRKDFNKVYDNLLLLVKEGFNVKINAVLIKGFNDNEIVSFINLTKDLPVTFRFIEFMPFDGNKWDKSKLVTQKEILDIVHSHFKKASILRIKDAANDTSRNYKIAGYTGSFAIISSVSNPFCDSCNRLRLTADGKLKNCLFSATEQDLLTALRAGDKIEPIIAKAVTGKFKMRGGMDTAAKLEDKNLHSNNRSMISIGG
jgi:cyclic pyranopterin phosphate synthase